MKIPGKADILHRLPRYYDVLYHDDYQRYHLRAYRLRRDIARRFLDNDWSYHAYLGTGENEGNRYSACTWCIEKECFEYV